MVIERSMDPNWLSNTYLVGQEGGEGFFVDAGGPVTPLIAAAERHEITPTHVLLTHHHHDLGTGYNHIALTVDDIEGTLARLGEQGIEPEKPPYRVREGGSLIAFVRDPDGYRIELIEKN